MTAQSAGDEKLRYVKCLELAFWALENAMYADDEKKVAMLTEYARTAQNLSETFMDIDMYHLPQTEAEKEAMEDMD